MPVNARLDLFFALAKHTVTNTTLWQKCLNQLEAELSSQQLNTWIRPLHAVHERHELRLLAPNRFVKESVEKQFLPRLKEIGQRIAAKPITISICVGAQPHSGTSTEEGTNGKQRKNIGETSYSGGRLNSAFTFENHVEGKSNQLARAASVQVGENPGHAYNPLFLYGGVGLGKTHLMHAAGNLILQRNPEAVVAYVHAERFVADMVKALQHNTMNAFKRYYRSLDALLIDDIQFFSGKSQSQEEFFHTFNTLLEGRSQVVITSDRLHKEIDGIQERLISRFGSGLVVRIDAPELETRVAILNKKARGMQIELSDEVAFFIAGQVRSNVRELEGALHRIVASARFTGRDISVEIAREALSDLMVYQERQITIQNIQKIVAEYFSIRVADLHSKRRNRNITRPRQIAMTLAKELTNMSLPEIGEAFGGRDHTTVLHACRKIVELLQQDAQMKEDYQNLQKLLSG